MSAPPQNPVSPAPSTQGCFHCGEPLPAGAVRTVRVDGEPRPVCCAGCEAVAALIAGSGLQDFYRYRRGPSERPEQAAGDSWSLYDDPRRQQRFVHPLPGGEAEARLAVEGLRCAACGWLIEKVLEREPSVASVQVNPATGRALLRWRSDRQPLSALLRRLAQLGYRPHPLDSGARLPAAVAERRSALKRLAVAGFGMMQVMTFAFAFYLDPSGAMETLYRDFLRIVSLLVATPVVFYAGWPFLAGAWRDLRAGRPGMDVPVALAVSVAYAASAWNTLAGAGEIYFDSATMFIFFLSTARLLEMSARHRAAEASESLAHMLPDSVRRLGPEGPVRVALDELQTGDRVRVAAGEVVPADARVLGGTSELDESLLTGESTPRRRGPGDPVLAGSVNVSGPLDLEVERTGEATRVSGIVRLLHRAQADRPPLARLADRVAGAFVAVVLVLAAATGLLWWQLDPSRAFEITLAVLVVTCPCALSLATPTALVTATTALARRGLLVTRGRALEALTRIDRILLDKTGTLTSGALSLRRVVPSGAASGADRCLALAAALEAHSAHPVARALAAGDTPAEAEQVKETPGYGVEGRVNGRRYRLGRPGWASAEPAPESTAGTWVALGSDGRTVAWFELVDPLRPDAAAAVSSLRRHGLEAEIASGDGEAPVRAVAEKLGISRWRAGLSPDDKLARVQALRDQGLRVAVVGDGINDAPVLAGADLSVALGSGAALAQGSADMVLLHGRLAGLAEAFEAGRRTRAVIRQNLAWALLYNATALPLAALGMVQPWMAALGMSASSLLVVGNALRLNRPVRERPTDVAPAVQPAGSGGVAP